MSALATMPTLTTLDPQLLVPLDSQLREELDAQRVLVDDARDTIRELAGAQGSDAAYQREIAERAMNKALDVVAEIEHAIERISTATYGACEGCGLAIPAARLEAIPYARSCVSCPPPPSLPRPV
jgi:RNA polymerase-binding transcription factor DksA